jgi:D-arabinose 1-dehydrogenase-like Zn-dependent alcohol dehydrogenase
VKALVKEGQELNLQELPLPEPGPGEILIRVRAAGLCRTDSLVMQGLLASGDPLIPGHELAGEITGLGTGVTGFQIGQRVTVHPQIGCGSCESCQQRRPEHCPEVAMLGVRRHGAFAEALCVPAHAVWKLPDSLSWFEGAYTEPVAAALGIFRAGIKPQQKGWVMGQNRIATLTARILERKGYAAGSGPLSQLDTNSLDYLVETGLDSSGLARALEVLRPGGVLIAKSRHLEALNLPWSTLVRKDIRIQGLYYGGFDEALAVLARSAAAQDQLLGDLIGLSYSLEQWQAFISPRPEASKPFLVMD